MSDLSPPTSRIIPTVHVYRLDVSLYDAQIDPDSGERVPLNAEVMEDVCAALVRFQIVCKDLGVRDDHIRIVATEATRTALNVKEFLQKIYDATGLGVEMLAKEDEGKIGALGIASGFSEISGLALDMGGGSMQITWIVSDVGNIRISPKGSFSFPYGAAALSQKLKQLKKGKSKDEANKAIEEFGEEMRNNFLDAYDKMQIPHDLVEKAKREGGFDLYLSGGGFRGWGYLLLYLNQSRGHHYPISIINGFSVPQSQFANTEALKEVARKAHQVFRVSDRRRAQVPAVAFLIDVLAETFPHGIREAHFCQGGVREGILFQELAPIVRKMDPLEVATGMYAPQSAESLCDLLISSIPDPSHGTKLRFPDSISVHVLKSFVNVMFVHATMSKGHSATAALYSTSTGLMSSVHGVSHKDRARLALILCERYQTGGDDLPPREVDFKNSLMGILTDEEVWWTRYLGKVGLVVSTLYPAGVIDDFKPRVVIAANWSDHLGSTKDKKGIELTFSVRKVENDPMKLKEALEDNLDVVEKVGKQKNWIGGRDGWGMKVKAKVVEEDIL